MATSVSILNYGIGNLMSVTRAISAAGGQPHLIETAEEVDQAERLVVPGVGAFGRCADVLKVRALWEAVQLFSRRERPFLGICVGMQLMFDFSTEFGTNEGFGMIPGHVDKIPNIGSAGQAHKIPHIGWSQLFDFRNSPEWKGTLLEGIPSGSSAYFVHSYSAHPKDRNHRLADADYNGLSVSAAVNSGSLYGVQFHPEKSGPVGLAILENFLKL